MRKLEELFPSIVALIVLIAFIFTKWNLKDVKNLDAILEATGTISSIIIAFLATMISILITLGSSEVMKRINKNGGAPLLVGYNKEAIISGFFLAIYSMVLNVFVDLTGTLSNLLLSVLVSSIVHFTLSSYRIVHFGSKILTEVLNENKERDSSKKVFKPSLKKEDGESLL